MKQIAIYKITSPSGSIYIGQSIDIKKRKNRYKNLSCKVQPILYSSLLKYGWENHKFEILQEFNEGTEKKIITHYEKLYIAEYKSNRIRYPDGTGMNLTDGGEGWMAGTIHSEQERANISKRMKGKQYALGYKFTDEQRAAMSKRRSGLKINKQREGIFILDTSTGIIYNSIVAAAKAISKKSSTIAGQLCGKYPNKTTLKYLNKP